MSSESFPVQTYPLEFDHLYMPTVHDITLQAEREALGHLIARPNIEFPETTEMLASTEQSRVSPMLFRKLGTAATGFSDGIENGLFVVLSGFGARENATLPRRLTRSLGTSALYDTRFQI
jgi:hypothetical protein